jgi:hypothetical protein
MEGRKLMPLSRLSGSLTTFPKTQQTLEYILSRVGSTPCHLCHLSVKIAMTPTARRPRRQRLASDHDLTPLLCDSSKLLPSKMITRHAGRNIRTDSSCPPSSRRAKKILEMRIHHRFHGSHVTFLEGQPGRPQRKGAKESPRRKRAVSVREAIRLDWMRRLHPKPH